MEQPKQGSSEVGMGALKPTGARFIAAIEPWHGDEVVVYIAVRMVEDPWRRSVIDTSFNDGHGLAIADLDQDGSDEIVAGYRGAPYGLYVYRHAAETEVWERAPIDEGGVAVSGIVIADLNKDGRADIIAGGAATNNVVWYENSGKSSVR
jgi:hypothetical protein